MVKLGMTWKESAILSGLVGLIGFFAFLFYQVIFGDLIGKLMTEATTYAFTIITLILFIGLLVVIIILWGISLLFYRSFTKSSKAKSIVFSTLICLIILFMISFISLFFIFPNYSVFEILSLSLLSYTLFSAYILPSPVYFWYIFIVAFVIIMIFMNKIFLIKQKLKPKKKTTVFKSRFARR